MMSFDLGLGTFSKLPPEVRLQIWQHFALRPKMIGPAPASIISKSRLVVLQTSHRLRDEIFPYIYENEVLRFIVSPQFHSLEWLTVKNSHGAEWRLADLQEAKQRGFRNLPYEKLKIRIEIEAPDPRDPGQLICLWQKCLDLVELLEEKHLEIEIRLQNTDDITWSTGRKPQQSIPTSSEHPAYEVFDPDFLVVLLPFLRLRNARKAKITLPEAIKDKFIQERIECAGWGEEFTELYDSYTSDAMMKDMEEVMMQTAAFGSTLNPQLAWNDQIIQNMQDRAFLLLDSELDSLKSPQFLIWDTSDMMRLQRFSSRYTDGLHSESKYEKQLERLLRGNSSFRYYNGPTDIEYRYRTMRALNPKSLRLQLVCLQHHEKTKALFRSNGVANFGEALRRGLVSEGFGRNEWHEFWEPRFGIRPLDGDRMEEDMRCLESSVAAEDVEELFERMQDCADHKENRTKYTIVPAPLGIKPNIGETQAP